MCNCVLTEDGTGRMIAGGRGGPAQPTHKLKGGGGTSPEKAPPGWRARQQCDGVWWLGATEGAAVEDGGGRGAEWTGWARGLHRGDNQRQIDLLCGRAGWS